MTGNPTVRSVVVGVERTEAGRLAAAWAADEAARRGLPLHLVHALDWPSGAPRPYFSPASGETPRHRESARAHADAWPAEAYRDADLTPPTHGWGDKFREAGEAALAEARAVVGLRHPGLTVTEELADGDPVRVLHRAAEDAALLVLGSRRLSSLAELLTTGGIAVPVAAHATCPVAVVRGPEHPSETAPSVVVGVDGSERSEPALAYAFDDASRRGAILTAVLAVPRPMAPHSADDGTDEGRLRLAESLAGWKAKYPDVVVRPQIVHGHAVKALAEASRHALALVVGTRGLGGFRGMLLGSVSHGLLHHGECPVVVVPGSTGD